MSTVSWTIVMTHLCRTYMYSEINIFFFFFWNLIRDLQLEYGFWKLILRIVQQHMSACQRFPSIDDKAYYVFRFSTLSVLLIIVQKQIWGNPGWNGTVGYNGVRGLFALQRFVAFRHIERNRTSVQLLSNILIYYRIRKILILSVVVYTQLTSKYIHIIYYI